MARSVHSCHCHGRGTKNKPSSLYAIVPILATESMHCCSFNQSTSGTLPALPLTIRAAASQAGAAGARAKSPKLKQPYGRNNLAKKSPSLMTSHHILESRTESSKHPLDERRTVAVISYGKVQKQQTRSKQQMTWKPTWR